MKKWIIKENKSKEFIRLSKFGFFWESRHIKLHRKYFIGDFKPATLFRNILQEIDIGNNFWCKLLYRLNKNDTVEFAVEDSINDKVEVFDVLSTYISFVSSIEFKADIYLDSIGELCRKYTINGVDMYPICTYLDDIGSFYKILGPKLSEKRTSNLVIEYEDL